MAATIKCEQVQKQEIKEILLKKLGDMMDSIREDEDCVSVTETEEGLSVDYPIGEIYGYSSDYVQSIPYIFKDLKKKYPSIEVWGIAYEYETISAGTFGPLFYCKSTDSDLTVTFDWQECAQCGKIIEGDAIYNSSQKDFEEGNLLCLCSPTCMLEYSLDDGWGEVEGNASMTEEEQDEIFDDEEGDVLKNILWNRIVANMNENNYVEDFALNKSRILSLFDSDDLDDEKKSVLKKIMALIG